MGVIICISFLFRAPVCRRLLRLRNKLLHPALEIPPLQQNTPVTPSALDTDISAQSHYFPLIAATGVLLPQVHYVPNPYLHKPTACQLDAGLSAHAASVSHDAPPVDNPYL